MRTCNQIDYSVEVAESKLAVVPVQARVRVIDFKAKHSSRLPVLLLCARSCSEHAKKGPDAGISSLYGRPQNSRAIKRPAASASQTPVTPPALSLQAWARTRCAWSVCSVSHAPLTACDQALHAARRQRLCVHAVSPCCKPGHAQGALGLCVLCRMLTCMHVKQARAQRLTTACKPERCTASEASTVHSAETTAARACCEPRDAVRSIHSGGHRLLRSAPRRSRSQSCETSSSSHATAAWWQLTCTSLQAAWARHSRRIPLAGAWAYAAYLAYTVWDGSFAAATSRLDWSSLDRLVRMIVLPAIVLCLLTQAWCA